MSARFFARNGAVFFAAVLIAYVGLLRSEAATAQTQTAVEYYD